MPPPDPAEPAVDGVITRTESAAWRYPGLGVRVVVRRYTYDHPAIRAHLQVDAYEDGGGAGSGTGDGGGDGADPEVAP